MNKRLMAIQYFHADEINEIAKSIIQHLNMEHIQINKIKFIRSRGSRSKRILARIHGTPLIFQKALSLDAHYIIEMIEEQYNKLSQKEQEKVIIHELLHIPKGFKGGLLPHKNNITEKKVSRFHEEFLQRKK